MNKEVLEELLSSKEFVEKLLQQKSVEDVKNILNCAGAEITDEDLMKAEEKGEAVIKELKTKIDSNEIKEEELKKFQEEIA